MSVADWFLDVCDCGRPGALLGEPFGQIVLTSYLPIYQFSRACRACGQVWDFSERSGRAVQKTKREAKPA